MQRRTLFYKAFVVLFILSAVLPVSTLAQPAVRTKQPPTFSLFKRPARPAPDQQLAYANQLLLRGKDDKALRHYRALVWKWPESPQAALAQFQYAKLLEKDGDYIQAFNEYRYLSLKYPGTYPMEEVLQGQLRIAKHVMDTNINRWFFGGVSKPERAIPYFREILRHSPEWDGGAEALYLIGAVYEQLKNYNQAAANYESVEERYPESPFAEKAAFARARSLYFVSREDYGNDRASQRAWEALNRYLQDYPEGSSVALAETFRETLDAQREKRAYGRSLAEYEEAHRAKTFFLFRKPAKNSPASQMSYAEELRVRGRQNKARRHYRALVLRWPDSAEAPRAQYQYARLLEEAGDDVEAFREYEYLMARYRTGYPKDEVLEREFRIAKEIMEDRSFSWLFGGWSHSREAIPYFQRILRQDDTWAKADAAQYYVAKAYEETKEYALAAAAFKTLLDKYPASTFAEDAAFSRAYILYIVARENPEDDLAADAAEDALKFFANSFPGSKDLPRVQGYASTLHDAQDHREDKREDAAYEEEHRTGFMGLFGRPKRDEPDEQLEYANRLRNRGSYSRARRHYKALVKRWPASLEAATAQYEYAKLLDKEGEYQKAFEAYEYLMDRYAGRFPHEDVLERQFRIAKFLMDHRKGKFLFFPGFAAPERAIPLFESIVEHGPNWERAAEVRYLIGRAYDLTQQYELAVAAYTDVLYKHPGSPFAEKAAFGKAYDLYQLAQENPYDEKLTEATWASLTMFLNTYPKSENATEALEYRKALYRRRAKEAYDKAVYYDRIAKNPRAAQLSYRRFIEQFPNSGWTTLAEIRIQELNQKLERAK